MVELSREVEDNATSRELHRIPPPAGAVEFQVAGLEVIFLNNYKKYQVIIKCLIQILSSFVNRMKENPVARVAASTIMWTAPVLLSRSVCVRAQNVSMNW
jgi:hypothetical protein